MTNDVKGYLSIGHHAQTYILEVYPTNQPCLALTLVTNIPVTLPPVLPARTAETVAVPAKAATIADTKNGFMRSLRNGK